MRLPAIISNNMVLQKNEPIKIWGWDEPGNKIMVTLLHTSSVTESDTNGKWMVILPPMNNIGSCEMKVSGSSTVIVNNIIFGDVWLASGQSNMSVPVKDAINGQAEIENASYPDIRLFHVSSNAETGPIKDVVGHWEMCSPENVSDFSAVAYFFGRSIHRNIGVPVGLIMSAWGGTIAEAWTSREALIVEPQFCKVVEEYEETAKLPQEEIKQTHLKKVKDWKSKNLINDPGDIGFNQGWGKVDFEDTAWGIIDVPGKWQSKGLAFNGVVWFRKEIDIPENWQGKDCTIYLGPCDKSEITWFNNTCIGSLSIDEDEAAWSIPRVYRIPGSLIRPGKNIVAVRIYSHIYAGGFMGSLNDMKISLNGDENENISIGGEWKYFVEHNFGRVPVAELPPELPLGAGNPNTPYILFDNMIEPLIPYILKGVIWYQGESNAAKAAQYSALFRILINDWRQHWGSNLHFYFVQLANYAANSDFEQNSPWAEIRDAQRENLKLPNTGMAVTIDIGDSGDIHPRNKQDVGARLALIARNKIYDERIEYSGPVYESSVIQDNGDIKLDFSHAQGLHTPDNQFLQAFSVAGEDDVFQKCIAHIEGMSVVLKCSHIIRPNAVRYGWSENPSCNLFNSDNLPASPFRIHLSH